MATVAQISDEERAIAIKATQTLADAAGVDILQRPRAAGDGGGMPRRGWKGWETTTGVDVAGKDDRPWDRKPGDAGILFENSVG